MSEKTNNYRGECLRNVALFLLPIVSVCCLQAWAVDLESAPSATVEISEEGIYTASSDLSFGALSVKASPVTFDFSATPSRKVVLSSDTAFSVAKKKANVTFKGGEWGGSEEKAVDFLCSVQDAPYTQVFLDNCAWTSLRRVIVGRNAAFCTLTLDNKSRIEAQEFRLVNGGKGNCALNILGGSGLFLSSGDTPFRTDTNSSDGGSGTITVAGEGSIFSAPKSEFRIYYAPDHSLIVSNKASLVANDLYVGKIITAERARVLVADGASVTAANIYMHSIGGNMTVSNNAEVSAGKLDVGREDSSDAVGANVLIADRSTLTAKEITIRNPGCGLVVSNATLVVDNAANNAVKVGYQGRSGGSFVLSGEDAKISYAPSGNLEVFAENSRGAEFRIENGATWDLGVTVRCAIKTSNSVFKVASDGLFTVGKNELKDADSGEVTNTVYAGTFDFGPGGSNNDCALSASNRIEIFDGGIVRLRRLRLNGHGNALVVSNATVAFETSIVDDNEMRIGYRYRNGNWTENGWFTRDCALVLKGNAPQVIAPKTVLNVENNSVLRFEIPEAGYADKIIPLKIRKLTNNENNGTSARIEIDCAAFAVKGGKLTLIEVSDSDGLSNDKAQAMINEVELPEGCSLKLIDNKKLVLKCPRRGFVLKVR
jgi:hypothetical protein